MSTFLHSKIIRKKPTWIFRLSIRAVHVSRDLRNDDEKEKWTARGRGDMLYLTVLLLKYDYLTGYAFRTIGEQETLLQYLISHISSLIHDGRALVPNINQFQTCCFPKIK